MSAGKEDTSLLNQIYSFPSRTVPEEASSIHGESQNPFSPSMALGEDQLSAHSEDGASLFSPLRTQASSTGGGRLQKFTYKIKGPHGAVYLSYKELDYSCLLVDMNARFNLLSSHEISIRVCYKDDDGDFVLLSSNEDLKVAFCSLKGADKLSLFVFVGGVALEECPPEKFTRPSGPPIAVATTPSQRSSLGSFFKVASGLVFVSSVATGVFFYLKTKKLI
jgi:hypothetical protein